MKVWDESLDGWLQHVWFAFFILCQCDDKAAALLRDLLLLWKISVFLVKKHQDHLIDSDGGVFVVLSKNDLIMH